MDRQLAYSYKSLTFNIMTMQALLDFEYEPLNLDIGQQLEALSDEMAGVLKKREQASQS